MTQLYPTATGIQPLNLPIVQSLKRGNLWFSSLLLQWEDETQRQYERAALRLMRLLASNSRAVVALGEH